jgi:hypothetical protein
MPIHNNISWHDENRREKGNFGAEWFQLACAAGDIANHLYVAVPQGIQVDTISNASEQWEKL